MFTHNRYREAILGVDLGQSCDPTALAFLLNLEQTTSHHNWYDDTHPKQNHWLLAHANILPLGTSYTDIAKTIAQTIANFKQQRPSVPVRVAVDATGLGAAAIELIHHELSRQSTPPMRSLARLEGIIFTGGIAASHKPHPSLAIDLYQVPKLTLLNSLATVIESKLLKVPEKLPHRETLMAQLLSLEVSNKDHRQPTIVIARSGPETAHADLVMALSMATWRMSQLHPSNLKYRSPMPK